MTEQRLQRGPANAVAPAEPGWSCSPFHKWKVCTQGWAGPEAPNAPLESLEQGSAKLQHRQGQSPLPGQGEALGRPCRRPLSPASCCERSSPTDCGTDISKAAPELALHHQRAVPSAEQRATAPPGPTGTSPTWSSSISCGRAAARPGTDTDRGEQLWDRWQGD